MRGGLPAAVLATALSGALAVGCSPGSAPRCGGDADCETGRRCVVAAGVCVGFDAPLLPAPDAGLADAAEDAAPAPADGPDDAGADDAGADDASAGG
jgi:hypothetical protein